MFYDVINLLKYRFMKSLKYFTTLIFSVIILIAVSGLNSCQKVIKIDLNSPSPQLVVEASISDKPGPYYVKLSKTVNFDNITAIPAVLGANVEISDSSGNGETLTELTNGIYKTNTLKGIPGQKYKLTIKTEGQIYESVSYMPYPVEGLKLAIQREVEDRPSIGGSGGEQIIRYQVNFEINDPQKYKNYYRFIVYHKKREISSRRVFDDQFNNGKIIADEFGLNDTINFEIGDTVAIELQNIDQGTYNFFRTLREGLGGLSFLSASPANPISNISNNGLGYFSAYSVNEGFSVIPN
jgi:hypothetical protein